MPEDITAIATALRAGSLTAETLLDRSLARIAAGDGALNSFVALDEARARAAARESDARITRGAARSPLEGVPLSIKDNLLAAGLPATWGSRALADFVPAEDELPIARLRAAGAVILGKTNVPELTVEGYTKNDLFGVTGNPWNPVLTPGGSSGGAAASVAAGFVPGAIGTDAGGSIRRPASHTGLIGWKPSTGRIARLGGFPTILSDFEVIGTLTRTMADARLLDDVLRGPDVRDRRSLLVSAAGWAGKPRVLYVPQFGSSPVDPDVGAVTRSFMEALKATGVLVTEGEVFFDLSAAAELWRIITRSGIAHLMKWWPGLETMAGEPIRAMATEGRSVAGADYVAALETVARLRAQFSALFAKFDLILTPTAAALPWNAATPYPDRIGGKKAGPRDHAIFTGWVNIGGLPAVSLPVGLSQSALPIGVQLVASFGQDDALLDFAGFCTSLMPAPVLPYNMP